MKKWCLLSLCCCWAVMGERSVNAAESVPPKSSKWDVVKEYLRRDREGGGRDVSMRPVATDSSTLPGSDGSANDPWAVQKYRLEHHGYAPYQEFIILDLIEKNRKTKIVGYLPDEGKFFFLSPSSPKVPHLTRGRTRVSRNGSSFKVGSSDGSEVFPFFDSTDEVAPWFFDKYRPSAEQARDSAVATRETPPTTASPTELTTVERLRLKLQKVKAARGGDPDPAVVLPK